MPFFHATWRRHLPSIMKHGIGGAAPDRQNFPVEVGVYLATDPEIAVGMLMEAYADGGETMGLTPREALAEMCVFVVDDSRINTTLLDHDPNIDRRDLTRLYRGIVDVTGLLVLSVDDIFADGTNPEVAPAASAGPRPR